MLAERGAPPVVTRPEVRQVGSEARGTEKSRGVVCVIPRGRHRAEADIGDDRSYLTGVAIPAPLGAVQLLATIEDGRRCRAVGCLCAQRGLCLAVDRGGPA